jgi:hypothetical protein
VQLTAWVARSHATVQAPASTAAVVRPAVAAARPGAMPGSLRIFYPAEVLTALLFRNGHLALRALRIVGFR